MESTSTHNPTTVAALLGLDQMAVILGTHKVIARHAALGNPLTTDATVTRLAVLGEVLDGLLASGRTSAQIKVWLVTANEHLAGFSPEVMIRDYGDVVPVGDRLLLAARDA